MNFQRKCDKFPADCGKRREDGKYTSIVRYNIGGLLQNCSISIANTREIIQPCPKSAICNLRYHPAFVCSYASNAVHFSGLIVKVGKSGFSRNENE